MKKDYPTATEIAWRPYEGFEQMVREWRETRIAKARKERGVNDQREYPLHLFVRLSLHLYTDDDISEYLALGWALVGFIGGDCPMVFMQWRPPMSVPEMPMNDPGEPDIVIARGDWPKV